MAEYFSLEGTYDIELVRVVDGDTIHVKFKPCECRCECIGVIRLFGIDTPEMKPRKSLENRDIIKKLAAIARDALCEKLCGSLSMNVLGFGAFGRIVATIYCDGENINEWLVESGHAVEYKKNNKFDWNQHITDNPDLFTHLL